VRDLWWTTFRLPFREPFLTAQAAFAYREGLILRLETDTGIVGLGEASPLPWDGEDALQRASAILENAKTALIGKKLDDIDACLSWPDQNHPAVAAARCALDVAVYDARAKAIGSPVADLLAPGANRSVAVNAVIGAPSTIDACTAARQAQAAGFSCVKLKVGMAKAIDEECERVAIVRAAVGPHIKLRLDANGAWSVEQAIQMIRALARHNLEFVEQPVSPGRIADMRRVQEAVNTPIAVDEDITDPDAARQVLQLGAAQVLILKPMVIGGLQPARQIIKLAQIAGVAVVVTTTLDAGVGTAAALHLAMTLPPGGPACGLATGTLLASDLLVRSPVVRNGLMQLPESSGLGVELDEAALKRYSSDQHSEWRQSERM
jgi:o-succinylbenzoate synthase